LLTSFYEFVNLKSDEIRVRDMPCLKQTSGTPPTKQEAASGGNQKIPFHRLPNFYVTAFLHGKCQRKARNL